MKKYSLALDGSTYAGTVAVISGHGVVAARSLPDSGIPARGQRGEEFMPMVVECLAETGIAVSDVERVICGAGPGSFTSLRIAASIAKGIAAGVGCPLFAVSSLLLIPTGSGADRGRYLAVLPAMRGESFVLETAVDESGSVSTDGVVRLIPTSNVEEVAAQSGLVPLGPGFGSDAKPHARGVARMLQQIVAAGECDLNTWEPAYGRLAEAQVKWEAAHGRPLAVDA
ncbi:MAG TPA: tRNA (adenosine(37)-N6)-threonylcarbamoyltransferase complex dimerization subunit type 1 TsaB [Gemmatimonadaceae bacterium]|nr:tRNA (adenosine(37)-N6)-threonylcarbamoyltransferase complex dimerization subunit type 1 TsaB [Gemmatimonadaceae bacterium]